jgi:hypothetical protein
MREHCVKQGIVGQRRIIEAKVVKGRSLDADGDADRKTRLGESELAIEHAMRSIRLSPLEPLIPAMEAAIALAHLNAGRYDDASSWAERAYLKQDGHHGTIRILAISHAMAGRLERAQGAIAHLRN